MTLKNVLSLVQVLGASTVVCGLLTEVFLDSIFTKSTYLFSEHENHVYFDNNQMFELFILGVVQIMFECF